jgi:hypothetical protein
MAFTDIATDNVVLGDYQQRNPVAFNAPGYFDIFYGHVHVLFLTVPAAFILQGIAL